MTQPGGEVDTDALYDFVTKAQEAAGRPGRWPRCFLTRPLVAACAGRGLRPGG